MSVTDDLLKNAEAYAAAFDKGDLPKPPSKKLAVIACMDARLDPARLLGLEEGDAHVIRNPGGMVGEDELRSLAISQHLLGTEEVILLCHTDCGMLGFTDEQFAAKLQADTGTAPQWASRAPLTDLDAGLRASIQRIKTSPFIPHRDRVRGFVYEVETGRLRELA